jgi:TPR repeat protein
MYNQHKEPAQTSSCITATLLFSPKALKSSRKLPLSFWRHWSQNRSSRINRKGKWQSLVSVFQEIKRSCKLASQSLCFRMSRGLGAAAQCPSSLMPKSLITASALIAIFTLTRPALVQEDQSPAPESPASKPATKPSPNTVPKDTTPTGPIIIAPQSSHEGRVLFDQKRYAEAKPWLQKACNLGNTDSCGLLGDLYYYGNGGVAQDYEQTRLLDKQACDGGSIESCGNLGSLYEKGLGGARNYTAARSLYKKACNGGSIPRCSSLGMLYRNGLGGDRDYGQASALFRKSCDGGFMLGCAALGSLYQNGQGTLPDYAQARTFYEEACNGREMVGCSWLGWLYEIGLGVPRDFSQARTLLKKACDGGFKPACDELSRLP